MGKPSSDVQTRMESKSGLTMEHMGKSNTSEIQASANEGVYQPASENDTANNSWKNRLIPLNPNSGGINVFTKISEPYTDYFFGGKSKEGFQQNGGTNDPQISLSYNFQVTTFSSSDIITGIDNSSTYFSINYPNSNQTNQNFTYISGSSNPVNYYGKSIAFYGGSGNIHKINNVTMEDDGITLHPDILGEMVITLKSVNNNDTLYLCFPLKNAHTDNIYEVDKLFALLNAGNNTTSCTASNTVRTNSVDSLLNKSIVTPTWVINYSDSSSSSKKNVFVFTEPILLNTSSSSILVNYIDIHKLFSLTAVKWTQITNISVDGENDIYIDCQPTGVSDDEIIMRQIPIDSYGTSSFMSKIDATKTFSNFLMFFIILILSFYFIPVIFKTLVIDPLNRSDFISKKQEVYVLWFVCSILSVVILGIISISLVSLDPLFLFVGVAFIILGLVSCFIIYFNTFMISGFMTTKKDNADTKLDLSVEQFVTILSGMMKFGTIMEILGLFIGLFMAIFIEKPKSGEDYNIKIRWWSFITTILFMIMFSLLFSYDKISSATFAGCFVGFFVVMMFVCNTNT